MLAVLDGAEKSLVTFSNQGLLGSPELENVSSLLRQGWTGSKTRACLRVIQPLGQAKPVEAQQVSRMGYKQLVGETS